MKELEEMISNNPRNPYLDDDGLDDDDDQEIEIRWNKCPQCGVIWSDDFPYEEYRYYENHSIYWKCYEGDDPPKITSEKLCPTHGEIILNGRRKGPLKKIDLMELEELNKEIRCPVCGTGEENLIFEPADIFWELGTFVCSLCNSQLHIKVDEGFEIIRASYREDLQTKEFNEAFEEMVKIINSGTEEPIHCNHRYSKKD